MPLMASPAFPAPQPNPDSQGPSQRSQPLQAAPSPHPISLATQLQDSHGPLQLFILDGAVQGLRREEQIRQVWVTPEGGKQSTPMPELRALPPNSGEETMGWEGGAGCKDQEHRLWNRILGHNTVSLLLPEFGQVSMGRTNVLTGV